MPKVLKDGQKRKLSVSISVDADAWENLEKRCVEIQNKLRRLGLDEKVVLGFSRSALVRECISLSSKPAYVDFLYEQIKGMLGLDDGQQEMKL